MELYSIIKELATKKGITSQKLAKSIGCTEAQMSLFFKQKNEVSLKTSQLDNCFAYLGINIETYLNRYELAFRVTEQLKKEKPEKIIKMGQNEMLNKLTNSADAFSVAHLIQVQSKAEYEQIVKEQIFDFESTYVYFRTMVAQLAILVNSKDVSLQKTSKEKNKTGKDNKSLFMGLGIASLALSAVIIKLMAGDKKTLSNVTVSSTLGMLSALGAGAIAIPSLVSSNGENKRSEKYTREQYLKDNIIHQNTLNILSAQEGTE